MALRMIALSKSRFTAGLQCPKRLYLECIAPELRDADEPGREALARAGTDVGVLARQRFPRGTLVEGGSSRWEEAVETTARLVADPSVPAIYEGAFQYAGARVRADVVVRVAPATFELIEVKAASRVREHHETDLALQLAVLGGAGHQVARARLMLLDREYVHPGGAPDLTQLFILVDLTEKARALVPTILQRLAGMRQVVEASEVPAVANGAQCLVPYRCPFFGHCHAGGPEHPVTDLPRLKPKQLAALCAIGVDDIRHIPEEFPGLTPLQRRAYEAVMMGGAFRDPAVVDALAAIPLPAHFVDFETFAPAVPIYPGTRPFEQVPFQWSNHVLVADGTVGHREFLHDDDVDPREAFARSLLAATEDAASLVVYSSFESDVLAALANQLPHLAPALHDRRKRIVDLLPIVRDHCYHPRLRGSFSIKTVLPAFVPALGYDDLVIRDGLTASLSHAALIDPMVDPARRAEVRAQLLAYCGRDTEAMVALYRVLGAPMKPFVTAAAGIWSGS
jgi:hypothetical protein